MSTTRPEGGRLPTRRAFTVAASVAAVAVFVYVIVGVLAPRSVTKPPSHLSANDLTKGLVVGGLAASAPPPSSTTSAAPPSSYLTAAPTIRSSTAPPSTAVPRSDIPSKLVIAMNVDKRVAKIGDMVTYEIVAHNVGGQTFSGALTINTHTPNGTLRCGTTAVLNVCRTPGDYDGSSKDPNAPHNNPPGVTRLASIKPGATVVLETLVVQIAPNTPATVLHNHAHVDGLSSITQTAPDVTTQAVPVAAFQHAPDVQVTR